MAVALEIQKLNDIAESYDYFWRPPKIIDQHIIEGYATTPDPDNEGDVVSLRAMRDALPRFMQRPYLGEMHSRAIGKILGAKVNDRGLYIRARVTDPSTWSAVKRGELRGLSISAEAMPEQTQRRNGGWIFNKILLKEISLVDRPTNPKARISVFK